MFDRVVSLIGTDKFMLLQMKTVLVVGVGGVGGYAVESLVRSGIKKIIIIDHDKISLSNLNWQIFTDTSNIGDVKVFELTKRLKLINPECEVVALDIFLDSNNINLLDKYKIDYIIDACDTVNTKKILIDYSINNNIKLISSMGTAKKMDPTRLKITDIRKTSYDPLAKRLRKFVNENKIKEKVMVVSSIEPPKKIESAIASISYVPSVAGLLCASFVINDIIKN